MRNAVVCLTLVLLVGATSSNAETLTQRMRMAQRQSFSQCMSSCVNQGERCRKNCLSNDCLANCGSQVTQCKTGCQGLRN